jgi:hypothetical protein
MDQLYGGNPPVALRVWLYGDPMVAFGSGDVLVIWGGDCAKSGAAMQRTQIARTDVNSGFMVVFRSADTTSLQDFWGRPGWA